MPCCSTSRRDLTRTRTSRSRRRRSTGTSHGLPGRRGSALLPHELRLEEEAMAMVVNRFIEPIAKELPLEYAIELNH